MNTLILACIDDVAQRLADPRAWLQGAWFGHCRADGSVRSIGVIGAVNCHCLGHAVCLAVDKHSGTKARLTELRSDVELELLLSVEERTGRKWHALYAWNDAPETSHRDVLEVLNATRVRLRNSDDLPRDHAWEARYDEVRRLAEIDARGGVEPRQLTGELATLQHYYDERLTEVMAAMQEAN
jgi:hypothetical protein